MARKDVGRKEKKKAKGWRRKRERRKLLSEGEFRSLVETGKTGPEDRRSWNERRKK